MININPISKASLILAAFALVTTGLVALTHLLTKDTIAQAQENAIQQTINQLVPADLYNNAIAQDCIIKQDTNGQTIRVFRARLEQTPVATVIESIAPNGYNGRIDLLVALDSKYKVLGVRTVKHNETPGLGDKIELKKSNWITHFSGLSLTEQNEKNWAVRNDGGMFDAFTGATITPRAVVAAVKNTLEWAKDQSLFQPGLECGDQQ
ncbi:RnfABCDGE type electron transport complex subunit G [Catenovulum agarivorans DS-2]|uniref:Ion-translocating oxidoreductase complex subunit G n=1 Tax=Catenovulum agarivorans DS-2 TaxID=1328313 RepID=W7QGM2_9ALTE|nr:electron transport complex subunit RsxG [Catenovulum agarivorans]EWH11056.1 RnfABCDGE type electron transport complex subunit G [Catenovulum agarivorans DS-2]